MPLFAHFCCFSANLTRFALSQLSKLQIVDTCVVLALDVPSFESGVSVFVRNHVTALGIGAFMHAAIPLYCAEFTTAFGKPVDQLPKIVEGEFPKVT